MLRLLRAMMQSPAAVGASVIALIWVGLELHLDSIHKAAERSAVQTAENLTAAFSEHLSIALKDIDRSIKIARTRYQRMPDEGFGRWLTSSELFDKQTMQVAVAGPNGALAFSTLGMPETRVDLSDREHIRVHRERKADELYISKPVIGRVSKKWSVQLTRRIENPDGSFAGVIIVSLDPSYFGRFYNSLNLPNGGHVAIIGSDGILRAASGQTTLQIGADLSGTRLFQEFPNKSSGWYFNARSFVGDAARLVSYRAVRDYPLGIVVGFSADKLFAAADARSNWYRAAAVMLTLLILAAVAFSMRLRRARARLAADLEAEHGQLERTRRFLDTVIENAPVPMVVKDARTGRFVLVNQAYEAFIGRSREQVIGRTTAEIYPTHGNAITAYDRDALGSDAQHVVSGLVVETPAAEMRIVNTTRLVVRNERNEPELLIVVIDDVTEKRQAEEKIARMAHHDPLTGLLNRARFGERLEELLAERPAHLALLLLDLDRFKQVNDTHGHPVGDVLLRQVAERLSGCVGDRDVVARLGGDEFAIACTGARCAKEVEALALRLRTAILAPYEIGAVQADVGISIGIACAPADAREPDGLFKRADLALYAAKADGGNKVSFFEPRLEASTLARRALEADLRLAIANSEFRLHYQPIVDLRDDRIVSLEALLRWQHPQRGLLAPGEFLAAAEETGLIVPIGDWAVRQLCADAGLWPDDVRISFNGSTLQLRDQGFAASLAATLAEFAVRPERVAVEVTEKCLGEYSRDCLATLEKVRAAGVQVVMDDFGMGRSSLDDLRRFRFDRIKIDCSFMSTLSDDRELSLAITQAAATVARLLGVPATAESVETREQLRLVSAAGCTEFQGRLFSPPRPAEEIVRLFRPPVPQAQSLVG